MRVILDLMGIDVSLLLSIASAVLTVIYVYFTWKTFEYMRQQGIIAETPFLRPIISINENGIHTIDVINEHTTGIAKNVSLTVTGQDASFSYSRDDEFLAPQMRILPLVIAHPIDHSSYRITYKNIYNRKVTTKGTIRIINGAPDFQSIDFSIEGV